MDVFLKFIATLGVAVGGLWALTKYVIEKGLVPAADLDLACNVLGEKEGKKIIEFTVHLVNKGSSIIVANDIRLVLKTINTKDHLSVYRDERKLGRLKFPNSLCKELTKDSEHKECEAFTLVPFATFIQPAVDQKYSFVTTVSGDVEFVHAHAEFHCAQEPNVLQKKLIWISRKVGLMRYSLEHIDKPHTAQRAFSVQ